MQNHFAQETIIYFEWKLEQLKSNGPRTVRFSQNGEKIPVLKSDIEWKYSAVALFFFWKLLPSGNGSVNKVNQSMPCVGICGQVTLHHDSFCGASELARALKWRESLLFYTNQILNLKVEKQKVFTKNTV